MYRKSHIILDCENKAEDNASMKELANKINKREIRVDDIDYRKVTNGFESDYIFCLLTNIGDDILYKHASWLIEKQWRYAMEDIKWPYTEEDADLFRLPDGWKESGQACRFKYQLEENTLPDIFLKDDAYPTMSTFLKYIEEYRNHYVERAINDFQMKQQLDWVYGEDNGSVKLVDVPLIDDEETAPDIDVPLEENKVDGEKELRIAMLTALFDAKKCPDVKKEAELLYQIAENAKKPIEITRYVKTLAGRKFLQDGKENKPLFSLMKEWGFYIREISNWNNQV